jgi:hypothetical protein
VLRGQVARAWDKEPNMLESFPGLLLVIMLTLTLILLPRLNEEQAGRPDPPRRTEELHVKPKRDS